MRAPMIPVLHIGNRNYSSWSLRPWLVLRWAGLPFTTEVHSLGGPGYGEGRIAEIVAVSPSGRVPSLHVGGTMIWDSLAIAEWAHERAPHAQLWPGDPMMRAVARSVTCEMHSGFSALRSELPCNIRRRAEPRTPTTELARDLSRIEALFTELRARHANDGAHLFGKRGIVDAFYTPVATRLRTYDVKFAGAAQSYVETLLADADFLEWEREAVAEPATMPRWDAV
jgi:glutathione S-transferase